MMSVNRSHEDVDVSGGESFRRSGEAEDSMFQGYMDTASIGLQKQEGSSKPLRD
jgi:hypothetical protein